MLAPAPETSVYLPCRAERESSAYRPGQAGDRADVRGARHPGLGAGPGTTLPDTSLDQGLPVIIRWQTALPIRQAQMRAKYGKEAATAPGAWFGRQPGSILRPSLRRVALANKTRLSEQRAIIQVIGQ